MLDVNAIRADFPVLQNNSGVIYFDNACMSLKPRPVLEAMEEYYTQYSGCHGRSAHQFSKKTTEKFEEARAKIANFINADSKEIVFTGNTTEGINLLASQVIFSFQSSIFNKANHKEKSVIIISDKEHNSNLVPWLRLKKQGAVKLEVIKTNEVGQLDLVGLENVLQSSSEKLRVTDYGLLITINHISNLDGVVNPVEEIIKIAHDHNALVHLDAAQSAPHLPIDVKKLGVDFLSFSGHKMLGPTGTGVFYARKELLEKMEPLNVGGGTVVGTTLEGFEFLTAPEKFEAGLQDYAGVIGLGAAADYLREVGLENVHKHEVLLNKKLRNALSSMGNIGLIGPIENETSVTSFTVENIDAHQVAQLLDKTAKIMVRSGQFCVHSWFAEREIEGAVRVSLYLYNTEEEIEKFVEALEKIIQL